MTLYAKSFILCLIVASTLFAEAGGQPPKSAARRRPWVYAHYSPTESEKTNGYGQHGLRGAWSLRPWLASVKQRVLFEFLELWEYFPEEQQWRLVKGTTSVRATIEPVEKAIYSAKDNPVLVELPKLHGLFYAKWTEDSVPCGDLIVAHPYVGQDPLIGPDKPGWIITSVARGNSGRVEYVPDPAIHCVIREVKLAPVDAPILLWAALVIAASALALYVMVYAVIKLRRRAKNA